MQAAHVTEPGSPADAIETVDVDVPEPDPGEVRIEVEACGLTHADVFARKRHPNLDFAYPVRGGSEIAGVIDAVGDAVTGFSTGDRVNVYHHVSCDDCEWCLNGEQTMCPNREKIGTDRPGGFAEYVTVPATNVDLIPDSLNFVTAAAYASSFTTAYRMIVTAGNLRPAERALVLGASGGVGHAALQLVDRIGAETYATTSSDEKADRLRPWADEVIDYTTRDFADAVLELTNDRGVDLVADHVGQETWQTSIDALAKGGRMVVCGATSGPYPDIDIRSLYQHHRRIIGAPLGSRQDFRDIGRLIARNELKPLIDRVLPLDRLAEGHRALENRDIVGKIIIQP